MKLSYPFKPMTTNLVEFSELSLIPRGSITLPIIIRYDTNTRITIVDCPSLYNCIMGRPFLHRVKVVASTYHLALKFLTYMGTIVVIEK